MRSGRDGRFFRFSWRFLLKSNQRHPETCFSQSSLIIRSYNIHTFFSGNCMKLRKLFENMHLHTSAYNDMQLHTITPKKRAHNYTQWHAITQIHTYIHTSLHTYMPTYLHTYIPTYLIPSSTQGLECLGPGTSHQRVYFGGGYHFRPSF